MRAQRIVIPIGRVMLPSGEIVPYAGRPSNPWLALAKAEKEAKDHK